MFGGWEVKGVLTVCSACSAFWAAFQLLRSPEQRRAMKTRRVSDLESNVRSASAYLETQGPGYI